MCLRAMLCSLNVYFLHFALTSRSCWLFLFSFSVSLVLLLVKLIRAYLSLMKYCYYCCCCCVCRYSVKLCAYTQVKTVGLQYLENMYIKIPYKEVWWYADVCSFLTLERKFQKPPLTRLTDYNHNSCINYVKATAYPLRTDWIGQFYMRFGLFPRCEI